ncbi:unnamed protein product [Acanthosepion pharaonis]|uniref:Uncharacterized protein n=1 Tax=Acanthosepion pharaonis TaxID=158019 RepID=A0A812BS32_ACAPH|nr:unnamed protein product [Sepia pharaonis]
MPKGNPDVFFPFSLFYSARTSYYPLLTLILFSVFLSFFLIFTILLISYIIFLCLFFAFSSFGYFRRFSVLIFLLHFITFSIDVHLYINCFLSLSLSLHTLYGVLYDPLLFLPFSSICLPFYYQMKRYVPISVNLTISRFISSTAIFHSSTASEVSLFFLLSSSFAFFKRSPLFPGSGTDISFYSVIAFSLSFPSLSFSIFHFLPFHPHHHTDTFFSLFPHISCTRKLIVSTIL